HGHHVGDINREYYRSKEEEARWKAERDPIANFGKWLRFEGVATEDELAVIDSEIRDEAAAAVEYALAAPYPDAVEVDMHVFKGVEHALPYMSGDRA
ncbi:MAG: thiamine pyrophosphate-dependent enzyme, partial [Boseongicola sp.]|nr:thiamine pyrophosphate-dependent enzyme [Boseongicola sp.]